MQYLLVGLPFAGKTTLAKELEKRFGFVRLSVDDVKFELGYSGVGDDDVPDEAWEKIFRVLDARIVENLKADKTVLTEYAWVTKQWRDRARKLAGEMGVETKIIFVNTPEDVVRRRRLENRDVNARFDIPDTVFEEALHDFEPPTKDENIIMYDRAEKLDVWTKENF